MKIKFEVGAIEIRYFPEIMSKFMSYFIVQSEDGVHNVVLDTLQNIDSEKVILFFSYRYIFIHKIIKKTKQRFLLRIFYKAINSMMFISK